MKQPYVIESTCLVERPLAEVFPFFADAGNLGAITPPWLHFSILTARPIDMRPGALIDYRLRLRGVPMRWRTRITEYDPPHRFVDVQERGPYRLWHHEHSFEAVRTENGECTLVRDRVRYLLPALPPGVAGAVHRLLVRPDLERVFAYRSARIKELLSGAWGASQAGVGMAPGGASGS